MNELISSTYQTPIEIALGIDKNGMTTATKLYDFLELNNSNYAKWYQRNILENQFAEENTDYFPFVLKYESLTGEKERQDFKLTTSFAKKLSMTQKNEKGEQAREYFLKTEEALKQISKPKCIEDVLIESLQEMKSMRERLSAQDNKIESVTHILDGIKEVVALDTTSWRDDTGNLLRKIGLSLGGGQAYSQVRSESYELLNKRMGVDLQTRLTNKRRRMADNGVCKSSRDKLTYVDVIAEDKKLIEGYTAIVKEMAIKYGVV